MVLARRKALDIASPLVASFSRHAKLTLICESMIKYLINSRLGLYTKHGLRIRLGKWMLFL
jgi:hypothetical protein